MNTDDPEAGTDPVAEETILPPDDIIDDAPDDGVELAPARTTFADLGLSEQVLRAVTDAGYLHPTPIQEQAIPVVLMGRDVLGCAQTGTGKTASFTLPMLDIMSSGRARARMPRCLILEPTRELAAQVGENFTKYTKYLRFEYALIIGGESMGDQINRLNKGVDVLIATPGRLIDLFERGGLILNDVKTLVIDEADRMLDMGFIPDVERIVAMLPRMRQTLFFSATMAPEIRRLADAFLHNPKEITVAPPASVAANVAQHLCLVRDLDKREALRRLLRSEDVKNALIFCNRKRDVDILYKSLSRHGFDAGMLHGDMTQPKRTETLEKFKAGGLRLLVCSDVAARGIDIGGLSHVFNFDVPYHAEDYVHRIGRTGRAGLFGRAFTLGTVEEDDNIAAIEKLIGKPIPRIQVEGLDPVSLDDAGPRPKRGRGRGGRPPAASGRGGARPAPTRRAPRTEVPVAETPAMDLAAEPMVAMAPTPEMGPPAEPPARRARRSRTAAAVAPAPAPEPAAEIEAAQVEAPRAPDRSVRDRPARGRPVRGRRDEDDGDDARVKGFGAAVPDFMRLPTRRAATVTELSDDEAA